MRPAASRSASPTFSTASKGAPQSDSETSDFIGPVQFVTARIAPAVAEQLGRTDRVARDRIDLEVHPLARLLAAEPGPFGGLRNERDLEASAARGRDREADAVERDVPLLDQIRRQRVRQVEGQALPLTLGRLRQD